MGKSHPPKKPAVAPIAPHSFRLPHPKTVKFSHPEGFAKVAPNNTQEISKAYHKIGVHEHNYTRILVPEVLCALVGPETQNVPSVHPSVHVSFSLIFIQSFLFLNFINESKHINFDCYVNCADPGRSQSNSLNMFNTRGVN